MGIELEIPVDKDLVRHLHSQIENSLDGIGQRIRKYLMESIPGLKDNSRKPVEIEGLTNIILTFDLEGKEFTVFISLEEPDVGVYWGDFEAQATTLKEIPGLIREA